MNTTLYKKGYALNKNEIKPKDLLMIESELNVKPYNYLTPDVPTFPIYRESKTKLYLPKYYGKLKFGEPHEYKLPKGEDIELEFAGSLRPLQNEIVEKYKATLCDDFSKSNGGIITLQCGGGKTVIGLNIISLVKKKTLIIVHKTFLMNQWKERIEQFLPTAKLGYIQGKILEVDDCDIVIGMLQSISMKEYDSEIFKSFGLCIIDEVHHIGAETFSKALCKINCHCMLGLSATPKRKDGLSKVFEYYIGDYVYIQKEKESRAVEVNIIQLKDTYPYCQELKNYNRKLNMPRMISNIAEYNERTGMIVKLVKRIIKKEPTRQILLLSDRKDQLHFIYSLVDTHKICSVGYYVGGMKEIELKKSEHNTLILGTYAMSSEGMDIPSLNTLILATPKSDIQQSVGRILRKKSEILPTIYDITDNFSMFINQGKKRLKYYHTTQCIVYNVYCDLTKKLDLTKKEEVIKPQRKQRKPTKNKLEENNECVKELDLNICLL